MIAIQQDADWEELPQELKVVVDPTIFRTAEVFLQGQRAAHDQAAVWQAISANVASLAAFIDAIVLNDKLPIFDYLSTFPDRQDEDREADARLIEFCNRNGELLVPVTVEYGAYWTVKQAALAELGSPDELPREASAGILQALSAFDWAWTPTLPGWQNAAADDQTLASFLYGGLLFSGYAKRLGGQHLIQPNRARLYAAAALNDRLDDEDTLFRRLENLPGEAPDDVENAQAFPALPSFLPYLLLADPTSPAELLDRALKLRASAAVAEYRGWHKELVEAISLGRRAREKAAEVNQLWAAVERELEPRGQGLRFSWTVEALFLGIPIPIPRARIEGEAEPAHLYAWTLRQLPGRRYQKLMMRMKAAHDEYARVDDHLRRLWKSI